MQACDYFILVGTHVEAVAQLDLMDVYHKRVGVPNEAKQLSPFFRVW